MINKNLWKLSVCRCKLNMVFSLILQILFAANYFFPIFVISQGGLVQLILHKTHFPIKLKI